MRYNANGGEIGFAVVPVPRVRFGRVVVSVVGGSGGVGERMFSSAAGVSTEKIRKLDTRTANVDDGVNGIANSKRK